MSDAVTPDHRGCGPVESIVGGLCVLLLVASAVFAVTRSTGDRDIAQVGVSRASATSSQPPTASATSSIPASTTTPPATSVADAHAYQLLDAAIVPSGARQTAPLPGSVFAQPWENPACSPLVDKSRFWVVAGDPQSITAYIRAHPPSWIPYTIVGQTSSGGQTTSYDLGGRPSGSGWGSNDQLDLTVASTGNDSTGIRADGEVVPSGASCESSGGGPQPAPTTSRP